MAPLDDIINDGTDGNGRPLTRVYITGRRDDALDLDNAGNGRGGYINGDTSLSPVQDTAVAPSSVTQAIQGQGQGQGQGNDLPSMIARLRDYLLNPTGFSEGNPTVNRLVNRATTDQPDQPRYQFWPEKMVRSGVAAAGDALSGKFDPRLEETYSDMEPEKSDTAVGRALGLNKVNMSAHNAEAIGRVMDMAGLAGGGALTERPDVGTLGSGPMRPEMKESLTPAIKVGNKIIKGKVGEEHQDIMDHNDIELDPDTMEPPPDVQTGFVDHKGRFLNHERAAEYAVNAPELVHPEHVEYLKNGILTSDMLRSDTQQPGAAVAALKSQSPFYSALEHATSNAKQDTMAPDQWLGYLKNQPGVKGEEMQWTGLDRWLGEQKGKVSKQDVQAYLDEHKVDVKDVTKADDSSIDPKNLSPAQRRGLEVEYREAMDLDESAPVSDDDLLEYIQMGQQVGALDTPEGTGVRYPNYQLPGGENYREHLLTLPTKSTEIEKGTWTTAGDGGDRANYRSSHWDEPNVLAHVRTNERDVAGKPSLHIEEIQSDWHQEGRKKGYQSSPEEIAILKSKRDAAEQKFLSSKDPKDLEAYNAAQDAHSAAVHSGNKVPDAPFKTAWPELALKRMIRMAAEEGKDRISWTPGEAQAARYDLSKQMDKVLYSPQGHMLQGYKDGRLVVEKSGVTPEQLPDNIGKEAAEKLMNSPTKVNDLGKAKQHVLEGVDLKVGGEGMKGFYDNMLPKMAEKLGKAYGVKVKQHQPPVPEIREIPEKTLTVGPAKWAADVPMNSELEKHVGVFDDKGNHIANYPNAKSAELGIKDYTKANRGTSFEVEAADGNYKYFKTRKDAEKWLDKNKPAPVWYFDIPPAMKDAALHKGFPLFAQGVPFPMVPVDHNPFDKKKDGQDVLNRAMQSVGMNEGYNERLSSAASEVAAEMEKKHGADWWTKVDPSEIGRLQDEVKRRSKGRK